MTIKHLLIDLDDTLWATFINNKRSLEELYTALSWGQYFVSFEDFFDSYYRVNVSLWERYNKGEISKEYLSIERLRRPLHPHITLDEEAWKRIDKDFLNLVRTKTELCPNALPVLRYLKERYSICILSNGFKEVQYDKIDHSGLSPYIDHIVLSDDVGVHKPDKRIFEIAMQQIGATTSDTLMIGDSYASDIVGASNAGIGSIWYNPYNVPIPTDSAITPPKHIVSDLAELLHIL